MKFENQELIDAVNCSSFQGECMKCSMGGEEPYTEKKVCYADIQDLAKDLLDLRDKYFGMIRKFRAERNKQRLIIQEMADYIKDCDIDEDICSKQSSCDALSETECPNCIIKHFESEVANG